LSVEFETEMFYFRISPNRNARAIFNCSCRGTRHMCGIVWSWIFENFHIFMFIQSHTHFCCLSRKKRP